MSKISSFLAKNIPVEEFCAVYFSHNIVDTATYFNTIPDAITAYCKINGVKKTKEQISQQILAAKIGKYGSVEKLNKHNREKQKQTSVIKYGTESGINRQRSETLKKTFQLKDNSYTTILKSINKEQFIDEYINQNKSREWIKSQYNLSEWTLDKIIRDFNCHKAKKQSAKIMLESKYSKYGSKEAYDKHVSEEFAKSCLLRYGVSNPNKLDWVRKKIEETNNQKLGVPYPCMLPEYRAHGNDSSENKAFAALLEKYSLTYEREFRIDKRFYDFKLGDILVEIDPTPTHNSTWGIYNTQKGLDSRYHFEKSKLARDNNFRCIHIFDWDNKDKIVALLKPTNEKLYARDCQIKIVPKIDEKDFLEHYHLQSYVKSTVCFGLYHRNNLVSLMSFGKSRYNKNFEWELLRYCSTRKVVGGAEKLFKHFLIEYTPSSVVSYCDYSKFDGHTYLKLGFKFDTITIGKHWYNTKTKQHFTDNLVRAQGCDRLLGTNYGKGTDNEFILLDSGFVEIYDAGQARYSWKPTKV